MAVSRKVFNAFPIWKYATPPQSPDISIRPAWKAEIFSSVQQAIRR